MIPLIISEEKLNQVEKALHLCHDPTRPALSCQECPYYRLGDSCWNKMHDDMKYIISWSRWARAIINSLRKFGLNRG